MHNSCIIEKKMSYLADVRTMWSTLQCKSAFVYESFLNRISSYDNRNFLRKSIFIVFCDQLSKKTNTRIADKKIDGFNWFVTFTDVTETNRSFIFLSSPDWH